MLSRNVNYYSQVFLKEYKYIDKNVIRHIFEDTGFFFYDSDDSGEE